jgi:hypothetical protein
MVNPSLSEFFIPTTNRRYLSTVLTSASVGYYGLFKYNFSPKWTLLYKLDYLALDRSQPGEAYIRHGLGIETYLNSNLILNTRIEKALAPTGITSSQVIAAQDDIFAMLRVWL